MSRSSWLNSDWACFDETGCLISLNYPAKLLSSEARNHQKPIWVKRSHGHMSRMRFYDWRLSTAPSDLPGASYIKPRCSIYGIFTKSFTHELTQTCRYRYTINLSIFSDMSKRAWNPRVVSNLLRWGIIIPIIPPLQGEGVDLTSQWCQMWILWRCLFVEVLKIYVWVIPKMVVPPNHPFY